MVDPGRTAVSSSEPELKEEISWLLFAGYL